MKTSSVVASVLFGTFALAAPLDRRAYATKTEVHIEYYTVYTTVTGVQPAAAATSDPALFYEKPTTEPKVTTTHTPPPPPPPAAPTTTATQAPPPPPPKPTTTEQPKAPTSTYTPPPPPPPPTTTEAPPPPPKPTTQAPPPPAVPTQPAAPAPAPSQSSSDGEVHTGGSLTLNYYGGGIGACGSPVNDNEMLVALGVETFGVATVDRMTGLTTNPWCNKKIEITNEGKTAIATIVDRCEGCKGPGLDATPALWQALTGGLGGASGDRIYTMSWKLVN